MHPLPRFALLAVASSTCVGSALAQSTAEYTLRDEVRGSRVHLASFPIRPVVHVPAAGSRPARVWAVNHHEDLVEVFAAPAASQPALATPLLSLHVPWNPGAVAYWDGNGAQADEVLVATRGTSGVTRLDATTGELRGYITLTPSDFGGSVGPKGHGLMAEPGDLLVDGSTDMAFVSCPGADAVVQIDLTTGLVVRRFHVETGFPSADPAFRCKSPLFLSFGPVPAGSSPRTVLVAPLHSGNGTTLESDVIARPGPIVLVGSVGSGSSELPDEDLFEITPLTGTSPGSVAARLRSLGTILFAHGLNPATGEHWLLNTEALNAGSLNDSEPEVNGRFAESRLTRTIQFGTPAESRVIASFEAGGSGLGLLPSQAVGQPFALGFGALGRGYIAGLLTDNVVELTSNGALSREWDLPDGAIPRGILPVPAESGERVLVYCWGTNEVLEYDTAAAVPSLVRTLRLTPDSTPDTLQRGRALFFDGSRSATGTLSCASCHVDGGSDLLAWDLSPAPVQEKGPMVTQTLVGIEKLGPFHWRGERQLGDFNPAFEGLLGNHDPADSNRLTAAEFADFEAFVFSLRNPANPHQNRRRVVDSTLHHPRTVGVGNAVLGQESYRDDAAVGEFSCRDCHAVPTGTTSDIFPIDPSSNQPARSNLKPTALHELWRKEMPAFDIDPTTVEALRPFLGFGFSHGGARRDLFQFLDFVPDDPISLTNHEDVTDFVFQWDQGLAPAAQYAFWLDLASEPRANQELNGYLLRQAALANSNCDVVVIGRSWLGGQLVPRRWFFDPRQPAASAFRCEDPTVPSRAIGQFYLGVLNNGEAHLFVGYPRGMGERIGLDRDMDGTTDFVEVQLGTDPYDPLIPVTAAPAPPTFVVAPTILWTSTRHARLVFETSTPTTAVIEYRESTASTYGDPVVVDSLARWHAPLIDGLRPSTQRSLNAVLPTPVQDETVEYECRITVKDRANQSTVIEPVKIVMPPFITHPDFFDNLPGTNEPDRLLHEQHEIAASSLTSLGNGRFQVDVTVRHKRGGAATPPAPDRVLVGRVVIQRCVNVAASGAPPDYDCSPMRSVAVAEMQEGPGAVVRQFVDLAAPGSPVERLDTGEHFVVGVDPTDGNGKTTFEFTLTNLVGGPLDAGDQVTFSVDAVLVVEPTAWANAVNSSIGQNTIAVPVSSYRRLGQWSFPDSGEALTFPATRL